jgi:hypothetical protein
VRPPPALPHFCKHDTGEIIFPALDVLKWKTWVHS